MAQYSSIRFDELSRTYLLHFPANYSNDIALPMVIVLHGGFGNAYNIEKQSKFSEKADKEGFIVVYPEGTASGILDIKAWNAGWCCGAASRNAIDDVGFINALMDTLITNFAVDTNRIYATGISNGGFMTYRLACEASHRIAAIAPVAASMSLKECAPVRSVPIIDFHSYLDTNVPYYGGVGDGVSNNYTTQKDSVLSVWAELNACSNNADTIEHTDDFVFIRRGDCKYGTEIQQYVSYDGGHSWPGGKQTAVGDPISTALDATDLIWDFFQHYSLACDAETDVSQYIEKDGLITLMPNPTTGYLSFDTESTISIEECTIYSSDGVLMKRTYQSEAIDISSFPKGEYLVLLQTNESTITLKILKE